MQARAVHTRNGILAAAASVFERRGYSAAKLEEIVEEAEVTKGALYFHYPSKADLARAVVEAHQARWATLVESSEAWDVDALETLGRLVKEVARSYKLDPIARAGVRLGNEYQLIDVELPPPFVSWTAHIERLLKRGQREGSVSAEVRTAAAARMIVGSFFGIQDMSSRLTGRRDLLARMDEWWLFISPTLARGFPKALASRKQSLGPQAARTG